MAPGPHTTSNGVSVHAGCRRGRCLHGACMAHHHPPTALPAVALPPPASPANATRQTRNQKLPGNSHARAGQGRAGDAVGWGGGTGQNAVAWPARSAAGRGHTRQSHTSNGCTNTPTNSRRHAKRQERLATTRLDTPAYCPDALLAATLAAPRRHTQVMQTPHPRICTARRARPSVHASRRGESFTALKLSRV